MKAATCDFPPTDFEIPQGVTFVYVDYETGKPTVDKSESAIKEVFKLGTEPLPARGQ
jgi:membrane carboxypeptidase/penicillin-binding protein